MSQPCVVFVGRPEWRALVEPIVDAQGFGCIRYEDQSRYVARLAEDQPALVVVDGSLPDRDFWVTTPRVSPATRRIPVVVIAAEPAARQAALSAGASFAIAPDRLEIDLASILAGHARVQGEGDRRELHSRCRDPLPPRAAEAIRKFNAGEYYKQHDLLEAQWMDEPGPVRNLYQAILQVGIAYHQVTRGNRRGALKMLLRARQWLAILPDVCQGVDIARLRADAGRVQAALEAISDAEIALFDRSLLRPVLMAE